MKEGAWIFAVFLGLASVAQGQSDSPLSDLPIEQRPYAIRAWVVVDPAARVTETQRNRLVTEWLELVSRYVGSVWRIDLPNSSGPALGLPLNRLDSIAAAGAVGTADKGWFFRVERSPDGRELQLAGREYDAATRHLGPVHRVRAPFRPDLPRSLFQLSGRVFSPTAEILRSDGDVLLRVQAAALPVPDPVGQVVAEGSIFRPFWIFLNADRSIQSIRDIPYTYLRVSRVEKGQAQGEVVSGLRRPLPQQVAGRYRLMALGARPAASPTPLRFVTRRESDGQMLPMPGAVLTARSLRDGVVKEIGTTGRDGEITLPAGFADDLVVVRLLAGGLEPLREIPVLPGETNEVREIPVEPRPEAVALEYRLKAVQDQIVDLIARRGLLISRLESRTQAQVWDDVKALLEAYRKLPTRQQYERIVSTLKEDAQRRQAELKIPLLTSTAMAQFAEVESLIQNYLGDDAFLDFEETYRQAMNPPAEAPKPTPSGLPLPAPGSSSPPQPGP